MSELDVSGAERDNICQATGDCKANTEHLVPHVLMKEILLLSRSLNIRQF